MRASVRMGWDVPRGNRRRVSATGILFALRPPNKIKRCPEDRHSPLPFPFSDRERRAVSGCAGR